jgi:hypothetical protein
VRTGNTLLRALTFRFFALIASRDGGQRKSQIPKPGREALLEQQNLDTAGLRPDSSKGKRPTPPNAGKEGRPSKKPKVRARKTSIARPGLPPRPKSIITPDVQTAYYAVEMLRSRWDKTHSISVLLKGTGPYYPAMHWRLTHEQTVSFHSNGTTLRDALRRSGLTLSATCRSWW